MNILHTQHTCKLATFLADRAIQWFFHLDPHERCGAVLLLVAQHHFRDVHILLAHQRAHLPDHTRPVDMRHEQDVLVRMPLQEIIVHLNDVVLVAGAITGHLQMARRRFHRQAQLRLQS